MVLKRYLTPSDLLAAETWKLLDWFRTIGADEFTIDCLGPGGSARPPVWQAFEAATRDFSRGKQTRERMSGPTADDLTRTTDLWALNEVTVDVLKCVLPGGLFDYDPREHGWFEDPVFYRDGILTLGVLSHEAFAVLRITDKELAQLSLAGVRTHESLPRAG
ncbi:MAG: hypothetical protein ABR585_02080 [Gemmatimonadaceae bacterium]